MTSTSPPRDPSSDPAFLPKRPGLKFRLRNLIQPIVLLGPSGLWLLLLLVIPAVLIFQLSLVPGLRPEDPIGNYGWENYLRILEPVYLRVMGRSLQFAAVATLMCLLLGFPVAYWIALLAPKRWQNLLLVAFVLPLWTSSLLRAYAWITILRPTGVLNTLLASVGLPPQTWLNNPAAVFIGLTYNFLPYMVLILYASLERLDRQLLEASADLGATPPQTFWRVTVPQTLPGIAAGCLLVFITSMGDFVVPELLGGASSMTIPRLIYNQFLGASRNWGFGSALSMVMILAVSIAIALLIKFGDRPTQSS
ncbi:MAG: ABC transporter permease [Synechococcales bacterium]|nr:ABC transporter permease [Synechococcales bacterium]